jgi:superkiller protein 3
LGKGDLDGAVKVYQTATSADPTSMALKKKLATLTLQQGDAAATLGLLHGGSDAALDIADERASAALTAAAEGLNGDGAAALKTAQRSVMLQPWERSGWEALALVRMESVSQE